MNIKKLMAQAQKMQKEMEKAKEELQKLTFEGQSGGGVVKVVVNGDKQIVDVIISKEIVDPEEIDMLQDLIQTATNEALSKAEQESTIRMSQHTQGLKFPGMF